MSSNDVFADVFAEIGTPNYTRPYCTLQDVIDECRNGNSPLTQNASTLRKFIAAIQLATGQIESFCKRDFWYHDSSSTPLTILPKWVAGGRIYLPYPIITLTGISQNGAAMATGAWISESTGNFSTIRQNLQSNFNPLSIGLGEYGNSYDYASGYNGLNYGGASNAFDSYWKYLAEYAQLTITGTFGFPLGLQDDGTTPDTQVPPPTLPSPVRRAATLIAAAWSGENRKEYRSMDGNTSNVLDENIPKEVPMILRPYVYRVV